MMGSAVRRFCEVPRVKKIKDKLLYQWVPVHDLSFKDDVKNKSAEPTPRWNIQGLKDMALYTFLYKTFIDLPQYLGAWVTEHVGKLAGKLASGGVGIYTYLLFTIISKGFLSIPFQASEFDKMLCIVASNIRNHPQNEKWQKAFGANYSGFFARNGYHEELVNNHCEKLVTDKPNQCFLESDTPIDTAAEQQNWFRRTMTELRGENFWKRLKYKYGDIWGGTGITKEDSGKLWDDGEIVIEDNIHPDMGEEIVLGPGGAQHAKPHSTGEAKKGKCEGVEVTPKARPTAVDSDDPNRRKSFGERMGQLLHIVSAPEQPATPKEKPTELEKAAVYDDECLPPPSQKEAGQVKAVLTTLAQRADEAAREEEYLAKAQR
eukprot:TRINITY_DN15227_c0_g1_i2.p1 TRINITY_DN15227_c0_g1~~TRINITY_DN15227_c0_g1_i2.p1  ORF type:complete len:375 (+),score=74.73 TRINITY_DN15227_c0_g1_i2:333-1457(+)